MLGLFISYKDVIRQISSADTRGCVFNGCVLPRLVISRQTLLQNHTLHPRPHIHNLTTSSSAVMKAYASHRLGLSHLPAGFDVRDSRWATVQISCLCPYNIFFQVELAVLFSTVMYSNQTDVFFFFFFLCLRGADFHLSQSPLWLNSSGARATWPGLLLWVAPREPMSHFHTHPAPLLLLMACR